MSLPFKRTKEHLRDELRAGLGFGAQVASTIQNKLMESWLDRAQSFIYDQYRPQELRVVDDSISTVAGTRLYDWPDQIDYRELWEFGVYAKIDGTNYIPLTHGIDWTHNNITESGIQSFPSNFDTGPQLEIWPEPNAAYPLRLEGFKRIGEFRADLSDWAASTAYAVGDIVVPTSAPTWPSPLDDEDHFYYQVSAIAGTGTSDSAEPTWPTTAGGTVIDNAGANQITWTAVRNDCTVDPALVLELALAWGKSHYRQADAEIVLNTVTQRLNKLKAKQHGKRRYIRGQKSAADLTLPIVSDPFVRS